MTAESATAVPTAWSSAHAPNARCTPSPPHAPHAPDAAAASPASIDGAAAHADWLSSLNDAQRAAATWGRRDAAGRFTCAPLLIIAGAGTGKTATLAHRVAHLVLEGVDPARILLLTFSRRAAQEMTRRAERLVAQALAQRRGSAAGTPAVRLPWAGTFHSIGARLLREHAGQLGLDPSFGILDRGDAADLIDVIRHEHGLSSRDKRFPRKDTCLAIYSHRVNTGATLERVLEENWPWCIEWREPLRGLFHAYVERKQANGVLDYDDLLLWWRLAVDDPALARAIGERFDHLLVDEYQDTNRLQADILTAIRPEGTGLVVVGDDAQAIYSFRAADVDNILRFPQQFEPPATRVTLELNYRSVQPVLDAANTLIAQSPRQFPKVLRARRGDGARPRLVSVLDDRAQADAVIDEVLRQREAGVPLKQQAVLFRSAHHSDGLEVELVRRRIPYVKYGGLKFLEATHIKDVLAVLRWADNVRNGIAAFRTLQLMPGMGPVNSQRCLEHLARGGALGGFEPPAAARPHWPSFAELHQWLRSADAAWPGQIERVDGWYRPLLEQRFDDHAVRAADLDMLGQAATRFGSRERFLTELTLDPPNASGDLSGAPLRDEDYLILSTVHSAKGQEWNSVYLLNVSDGNFPNEFATGRPEGIDEERRLLYVGITRARDTLWLVEPQRYYLTGQTRLGASHVYGARSRFLTPALVNCLQRGGPALEQPALQPAVPSGGPRVDVAARLRRMW
ncbi:MAG TPA: ATP-dependent helicase [Burkholderiaceae bacterium]|nr:ATP-dependent helicase [Burkholderiaceae bacterium]